MTYPPKKELPENEFIHESYSQNPLPIWLWFFLAVVATSLLWGTGSWYYKKMGEEVQSSPFLQVTNREFSLFLWQFPEHMRINAKSKNGYLPGFQYEEKVSLFVHEAENYVVAPPETIFLYHTWKRLLGDDYISTPIPTEEFKEFLAYAPEWEPANWPKAPSGYKDWVAALGKSNTEENLESLPNSQLPVVVRQAFQGWKNYFKEGDQINQTRPTYAEMQKFLQKHPNYARNFWRNILAGHFPEYLRVLMQKKGDFNEATIPLTQLAPFLRVAYFNFSKSQEPTPPPT